TAWELVEGVYDAAYENTMRTAFFNILRTYPRETGETFLYYKPGWLINALIVSFVMNFHGNTSLWLITLAELAAVVLFRLLSDRTAWELVEGVYDAAYENTMRTAFFNILRTYPRETGETFLYYKPGWLINALIVSFVMNFHGNTSLWLITLAELAAVVLFRLL